MYILHVKKKWAVTLLSGEGKRGDEELLNNWDFIYKQNSAGDMETDMKTFWPVTESREHMAYKGETKLDN